MKGKDGKDAGRPGSGHKPAERDQNRWETAAQERNEARWKMWADMKKEGKLVQVSVWFYADWIERLDNERVAGQTRTSIVRKLLKEALDERDRMREAGEDKYSSIGDAVKRKGKGKAR